MALSIHLTRERSVPTTIVASAQGDWHVEWRDGTTQEPHRESVCSPRTSPSKCCPLFLAQSGAPKESSSTPHTHKGLAKGYPKLLRTHCK